MSIQVRNRRKKSFKPNEENRVEEPSNVVVKQEGGTTLLNVRRSSRKPKPKQRDDEDMIFTERETTEKDNERDSIDALLGFEGLESSENMYLGSGVRRETRKTYQNYLETLGYNTDFSKISAQESLQHAAKVASSQRTISKQSNTEEKLIAKHTIHIKTEQPELPEETYFASKVRASSRTPKPKRTFALLEDHSAVYSKQTRASILENVSDLHSDTETKLNVLAKTRKSLPENSEKEQKSRKSRRHASSSLVDNVLTMTPLSKQDVDETERDENDSSLTRSSTRVRVPKRKFSLIDEVSPETEVKRQRVMSPEQTIDCKVQGSKNMFDKIQEDDTNIRSCSSLVIKRSDLKKQRGNRRKEEMVESKVDHNQEKELNISKKIEFFSSNSSHSESEKKPESKRRRPRIEAIVQKLKISKDTTLKQASKQTNIDKKTEIEEKSSTSRKITKRKRETSNLEKSGSEKEEKRKINDSIEGEHIVLKLTIPHGSPKTEEKKHHHKHHHKHKKESEIVVNKKKIKSEGEEDVAKSKETSSKDSQKLESDMKIKKKKKKSGNKEDSSESLSSDTSAIPHVKLVIKKSPVKSKHVEVTTKDKPASKQPSLIPQEEAAEQNIQNDQSHSRKKVDEQTGLKKKKDYQSDLKKKVQTKKVKPLSKKKKKRLEKLKKAAKNKTVSAYSLFTKSRRKHLLETEPDLDFATTSRRLAGMWKQLPVDDQEYWRAKARIIRKPELDRKSGLKALSKGRSSTTKGRYDNLSGSHSKDPEAFHSSGTDVVDMAAYLKLLGESLCSIGMCLKRQDQMEVHGSLSVLLDTALCSIVPLFCLTSQLPEMAGCSAKTQAEILNNLAYIIPGL